MMDSSKDHIDNDFFNTPSEKKKNRFFGVIEISRDVISSCFRGARYLFQRPEKMGSRSRVRECWEGMFELELSILTCHIMYIHP